MLQNLYVDATESLTLVSMFKASFGRTPGDIKSNATIISVEPIRDSPLKNQR